MNELKHFELLYNHIGMVKFVDDMAIIDIDLSWRDNHNKVLYGDMYCIGNVVRIYFSENSYRDFHEFNDETSMGITIKNGAYKLGFISRLLLQINQPDVNKINDHIQQLKKMNIESITNFSDIIVHNVSVLLKNNEVKNILNNYLRMIPLEMYTDTRYMSMEDKLIYNYGHFAEQLIPSEYTDIDIDLYKKENNYVNEYLFPLAEVIGKRYEIDNYLEKIFVTYSLVRTFVVEYCAEIFMKSNVDIIEMLQEKSDRELIQYLNYSNIDIAGEKDKAYLTYYLLYRGKKNYKSYYKSKKEIEDVILECKRNKKASSFEQALFKNSESLEYNIKEKNISIDDVDIMDGNEFEHFICELYSKMGYLSEVTKQTCDQGLDVIAEKNGKKLGIQAKCYSNTVGNSAIQEAVAGMNYYKCDKVVVVTNNYFTKSAIELAQTNNVVLWDRQILKEKIIELF